MERVAAAAAHRGRPRRRLRAGREINRYVKDSFSREATDALLDRIAAENDVVVTAIGD